MAVANLQVLLFGSSNAESIRSMLLDVFDHLEPLDLAEPRATVQGWVAPADAGELPLDEVSKQIYLTMG